MKVHPNQQQLSIYEGVDKDLDKCEQVGCDDRVECMKQDTGPEALCLAQVKTNMDAGFKLASCALSFFRGRHGTRPRFKKSKRNHEVRVYKDHVRMARLYIRKAREAGFRGSVVEKVLAMNTKKFWPIFTATVSQGGSYGSQNQ